MSVATVLRLAANDQHPLEARIEAAQLEGLAPNVRRWWRFADARDDLPEEIQALGVREGAWVNTRGAYVVGLDRLIRLAEAGETFNGTGLYPLINRVLPAAATRRPPNTWEKMPKGESTEDGDIACRRDVMVDFDAKRPSNTSASSAEMAETVGPATEAYAAVADVLGDETALAYVHSGNGRQVHIALSDLPNDAETKAAIERLLKGLAARFDTAACKVDTSVADAKRLGPLPGTTKKKGLAGVPDRPHRRSAIVLGASDAEPVRRLTLDELRTLVDAFAPPKSERKTEPARAKKVASDGDDLFAKCKAVDIRRVVEWMGLLEGDNVRCPGCGICDGTSVVIYKNGVKCSHNRCSGKGHKDGFRTTIDVVMEAQGLDAFHAAKEIAEKFGIEIPQREQRSKATGGEREFKRGDHVEIAARFVAELREVGPTVYDEGELYQYAAPRGLWQPVDPATQSVHVQSYAGASIVDGDKLLKLKASDVAGAIKLANHRAASRLYFSGAPQGLAFSDCFVSVAADGTISVTPHAPENRARYGYSFAYSKGSAPKRWLKFLDGIFRDDADKEEKTTLVQEFFGGCLFGAAPTYQQCVIGKGGGDNGKSKLGKIIAAAMPAGSTSSIPPQLWEQEYRRARLAGKLLNFVAELPEAEILDSESFKAIVAGDHVEGRHIREAPFDFLPRAGHYFAANRLPGSRDQTEGFWRRMIVLTFNRSFKDDPARNPVLDEEIIGSELPQIVGWLIAGAARLAKQRAYTIPSSHTSALAEWRRTADSVSLFVSEKTRPSRGGERGRPAADLYFTYRRWCEATGHRALASNKFGERMSALGFPAHKKSDCNRYPVEVEDCGGPVEDFEPSPPPEREGRSWS